MNILLTLLSESVETVLLIVHQIVIVVWTIREFRHISCNIYDIFNLFCMVKVILVDLIGKSD